VKEELKAEIGAGAGVGAEAAGVGAKAAAKAEVGEEGRGAKGDEAVAATEVAAVPLVSKVQAMEVEGGGVDLALESGPATVTVAEAATVPAAEAATVPVPEAATGAVTEPAPVPLPSEAEQPGERGHQGGMVLMPPLALLQKRVGPGRHRSRQR